MSESKSKEIEVSEGKGLRKYPKLWQAYQWWYGMVKLRTAATNRIHSIESGRSNLILSYEEGYLELLQLDRAIDLAREEMIAEGKKVGPIFDWLVSIKGIGDSLAVQLLAQTDDVEKSKTVSAYWRYAGWAVMDGKAERSKRGEKNHFNKGLKSVCWNIADQFIKHRTPVYRDEYDFEKARQRTRHPEAIKVNGKWKYNPGHLHNRALRKMIKLFLSHAWLKWRTFEGLPTTEPYPQGILGHDHYIPPPETE